MAALAVIVLSGLKQRNRAGLSFESSARDPSRLLLAHHPGLLSCLSKVGHVEQFGIELTMGIGGLHDNEDGAHDHKRQPAERGD